MVQMHLLNKQCQLIIKLAKEINYQNNKPPMQKLGESLAQLNMQTQHRKAPASKPGFKTGTPNVRQQRKPLYQYSALSSQTTPLSTH